MAEIFWPLRLFSAVVLTQENCWTGLPATLKYVVFRWLSKDLDTGDPIKLHVSNSAKVFSLYIYFAICL